MLFFPRPEPPETMPRPAAKAEVLGVSAAELIRGKPMRKKRGGT